jgi:GH15 family glucan-1,4-alpha-glucosidase
VIAVAAGSFQSELGCSGDWDPSCLRSWLEDPDGDGTYSFVTTALPAGTYDGKVAINEDWTENYGQGGVPGGDNISFTVPAGNPAVTFSYVSVTHVLSITVAADHGAPGGPGAVSHFDLARKDCLGTARNRSSKVWYTVANGILSDVYYPTVDNTNVETLQYVVTDGATFTDLQARDMTYSVDAIAGSGGMACRVTATARSGRYRIHTDYLTDPARNTVLMRVRLTSNATSQGAPLQLYVRLDPTVNGNGGGGNGNGGADTATVDGSTGHPILLASDLVTATNAANRDYAQPVYAALDGPFANASVGFAGSESDGIVQLDASHALTPAFPDAKDGNVVGAAQVTLGSDGAAVLALGFGATGTEAIAAAQGSLTRGFARALVADLAGRYDRRRCRARVLLTVDRVRLAAAYYPSANVLKASEDKTFPGAISRAVTVGPGHSSGDPATPPSYAGGSDHSEA